MALTGALWTLSQLNSFVDTAISDGGNVRWTSAEKDTAICAAILSAHGYTWEERIDSEHTWDMNTQRYAVPAGCVSVREIYFEDRRGSGYPRKFIVPTSWSVEGTTIVFSARSRYRKYQGVTMYITYNVYQGHLLNIGAADLVTTANDATVTSATGDWLTKAVLIGDSFEIIGGADAGIYFVSSVTNGTTIELHTELTANAVAQVFRIAYYTNLSAIYVNYYAMSELYELAARNRPGVEIDETLRLAAWNKQLAQVELERIRKRPKGIRMY